MSNPRWRGAIAAEHFNLRYPLDLEADVKAWATGPLQELAWDVPRHSGVSFPYPAPGAEGVCVYDSDEWNVDFGGFSSMKVTATTRIVAGLKVNVRNDHLDLFQRALQRQKRTGIIASCYAVRITSWPNNSLILTPELLGEFRRVFRVRL